VPVSGMNISSSALPVDRPLAVGAGWACNATCLRRSMDSVDGPVAGSSATYRFQNTSGRSVSRESRFDGGAA